MIIAKEAEHLAIRECRYVVIYSMASYTVVQKISLPDPYVSV